MRGAPFEGMTDHEPMPASAACDACAFAQPSGRCDRTDGIIEQWIEGRYSFYCVDPGLPAWARRMLEALHAGAVASVRDRDHDFIFILAIGLQHR